MGSKSHSIGPKSRNIEYSHFLLGSNANDVSVGVKRIPRSPKIKHTGVLGTYGPLFLAPVHKISVVRFSQTGKFFNFSCVAAGPYLANINSSRNPNYIG